MLWSWIIWLAIVLGVLSLGYYYISRRLISHLRISPSQKKISRFALAGLVLIPFVWMILFRFVEPWGAFWSWFVYVGLGFLSLVLTGLLIRDLLFLPVGVVRFLRERIWKKPKADPSRREFLLQTSNLVILGAAAASTGYGIFEARRKPGMVTIDVPISRLPKSFDGFTILQISDIHAGLTVMRDWIEIVAAEAQALKPDLIAFTGDLADGSVGYLRDEVAPLAELRAPSGKFFVTGNHEYYSGARPWVKEAERMGYRVLMNEHELISRNGDSIVLAGVTDYTGGDFYPDHTSDPKKAIVGAPDDKVRVLLAHQPRSLFAALPFGFDLQISGHTHGGQFFPWNLIATLGQPYISGLHKHDNTWIYVSRGTGYWGPPVRLAARSEITLITLRQIV